MAGVRVVMHPDAVSRIENASDPLLNRLTEAIAADARRDAPVDSGALRLGIEAERAQGGTARVNVSRNVPGDDPDVPVFVEYGTEKMQAQPYMRPAVFRYRGGA